MMARGIDGNFNLTEVAANWWRMRLLPHRAIALTCEAAEDIGGSLQDDFGSVPRMAASSIALATSKSRYRGFE
jgi:hypothetical protein